MELRKHRQNRHTSVKHYGTYTPHLMLKRMLLYRYVQLAWIVQERKKSRLQLSRGLILSIKKSNTGYLTSVYLRGMASSRNVATVGYFSLRHPSFAFLETPNSVFL